MDCTRTIYERISTQRERERDLSFKNEKTDDINRNVRRIERNAFFTSSLRIFDT